MASLFEIFRKRKVLNGIRVKPNKGKSYDSEIDPDSELIAMMDNDNNSAMQSIQQFREISGNREEQYKAFDEMEKDATIAAALKMYTDDATQYNLDGKIIWAESDDSNVAKFANRLIDVLRINENAWTHIYNLCKYGDLYLETFYDDEKVGATVHNRPTKTYGTDVLTHKPGSRIEEYVQMVDNPASIFDLRKKGKISGFIHVKEMDPESTNYSRVFSTSLSGTEQTILPSDKYIHIMLSEASNRYPETFEVEFTDDDGNKVTQSFKVSKGKSMLHDAFKSFRELKLMEDSVLMNRVTRSAITRILQIEVGDMPKNQVREKLRKVKQMIEQKNYMDKNSGDFTNMATPGPVDNVVYVPTRQGDGAITSTTLGGDVDPKSLIDLDYYKQKLSGGLGIPLAYLEGTSGDGGGLSSGTALTKLDNRYARSIKRIQTAYISGIETLINIFAIRKGLTDYVNEFKIRMLSPSTIEDADRDEQLQQRITMTNDLISIISSNEDVYSKKTVREVTEYLMSTFLNKPEVSDILKSQEEENEEADGIESNGDNDIDIDMSMHGGGGFASGPSNFDMGEFSEPNFDAESSEETDIDSSIDNALDLEEPVSDTNGFGDFEEFA